MKQRPMLKAKAPRVVNCFFFKDMQEHANTIEIGISDGSSYFSYSYIYFWLEKTSHANQLFILILLRLI